MVDDCPASRAEAVQFAKQLLAGQAVSSAKVAQSQSQEAAACDSGGNATGALQGSCVLGEKRVRNDKMKSELSISWEFPSYKAGLTAIHADGVAVETPD